jgi:hypothetical protein
MLDINCEVCRDDPVAREQWGCDEPTQVAVWELDGTEFFSCPLLFVPDNVVDWYREYSYDKDMNTARSYDVQLEWYVEAKNLYEESYRYYCDVKKSMKKRKSGDMSAFQAGLKGRQ